jgi:hypothetical protein
VLAFRGSPLACDAQREPMQGTAAQWFPIISGRWHRGTSDMVYEFPRVHHVHRLLGGIESSGAEAQQISLILSESLSDTDTESGTPAKVATPSCL